MQILIFQNDSSIFHMFCYVIFEMDCTLVIIILSMISWIKFDFYFAVSEPILKSSMEKCESFLPSC